MDMSTDRFTEQIQKKQCVSCGDTIKTDDKLLRECRSCYLDNHGDIRCK